MVVVVYAKRKLKLSSCKLAPSSRWILAAQPREHCTVCVSNCFVQCAGSAVAFVRFVLFVSWAVQHQSLVYMMFHLLLTVLVLPLSGATSYESICCSYVAAVPT